MGQIVSVSSFEHGALAQVDLVHGKARELVAHARVAAGQESRTLIGVVALLTTLVMNHHYTNQFVRR